MEQTYFRKGFGLKKELRPLIDAEYQSALVGRIRARGYTDTFGDVTVRLAQEFGFCYGVDLVGEIIHNPHVNQRMTDMGIAFIYPDFEGHFDFSHVTGDDVVIIPAFGVTLHDFQALRDIGCILVDTTCGSVLHVWKRVESYARDGFTSVIHGKYTHEESRATASQAQKYEGGKYIVVRDMEEAELICDYIADRPGHMTREEFLTHFTGKSSAGFDPDVDLKRVGVANQTTMLASDSIAIGMKIHEAMLEIHDLDEVKDYYRSFGTICSATQERQDAVAKMMESPPEVMIVIGGYNSSNTNHLAHLCRQYTPTYHVQDASCIDVETGAVRHKPELSPEAEEVEAVEWLPEGPFELGITAGASTPNNKIGEALLRVLKIRGIEVEQESEEPQPA
jgi:4-hydroxy-3-methylbut-2-enyl diphosphate reductase